MIFIRDVSKQQFSKPPSARSSSTAVQQAAEEGAIARLLMTQPGVGLVTALAFVVTIGEVSSYLHPGKRALRNVLRQAPILTT